MYLLQRVLRKSQMAFDFSNTHTESRPRAGHKRHLASGAVVNVAPTHATVHVANGDLRPGQKVMFKPHGAPRKRRGTVIGRNNDGAWHIEGVRQGHQFAPERFTLPREHVWTMEEHEAQKRTTTGTREATSAHGRAISVAEMRRRGDVARKNLGLDENIVLSNPRVLQSARATLSSLAAKNDLDPRFTIASGTLRNDDPEAMTLYSEYATASLTSLRGLAGTATPEDIQMFHAYLAGEEVPSRIAYNMHRSGKTAAIRYLRRQHEDHMRDQEYSTTTEDDSETGMRAIAATTAHNPYHESDLAHKVAMERTIENQLQKMNPFEADLIRRKFALGDYIEEQSNEQIARDLGGNWTRITVGQAVKDALLKFARSEGANALRGFLKSVKEHVDRKTICVDFDGVIADYSQGYQGEDVFGDPLPGAAESLEHLRNNGWKVIIFTTRPNTHGLRSYLRRNGIPFDEINENSDQPEGANPGKPIADIYLDDRSVRFHDWELAMDDILGIGATLQKSLRLVPAEDILIKSHIRQYTKRDGTVVQEHDDKRIKKHVDLLRHENSHKEDIHPGAKLAHGQELVDHLKGKGWKHKEVSAARRNKDLPVGKKEDLPEPSKIKGANQENPALVSAQRVLNRLHEAARDADDPVAALLAVSTSRANPYLKAVDDERTKLLKHFGYEVNHDEKHDKFDKDGHTVIVSKDGDQHTVEFAGGDDKGKEQLQSVRGKAERESFDGGKKEAKFTYGDENTAYTGKMNKIQTKFALVDADSLTTSHNYDGHVNQAYPQEIQPRDRARIASRMQIQNIANDLRPELYGISHLTSDGAPIVGPDGVVESGNGRTLALGLAYHSGKADHYKEWLKDYVRHVGIDPEEVGKMKKPMLVRVRQTEVDRPEFAREANQSNMMQNSPVEQAFSDAERISDTMLTKYKPGEDGDVLADDNRPFIQEFLGTLGANERASLIDKHGDPNKRCVERVQAAVFARVYKSEVLTELMTESADNDVKNIIGAMSVSAADYAKIQKHGDLDVTNELLDAIDIFRTAKRNGGSIDDHLDQAGFDMQGNMTTVDPTTEALTRGIHEFKGSRKKLTALFKIITQKAAEEIDGRENDTTYGAADMFGNAREKKGKKQIVAESVAQARRGDQADAGQDDLFRASSYPAGLYLLRKSTGRTHGNERGDQAGKAQDGAGCHRAGAGHEGRLEKAEDGEKACRPNGEGKAGDGPRRGAGAVEPYLLKSNKHDHHAAYTRINSNGTASHVQEKGTPDNPFNPNRAPLIRKQKGQYSGAKPIETGYRIVRDDEPESGTKGRFVIYDQDMKIVEVPNESGEIEAHWPKLLDASRALNRHKGTDHKLTKQAKGEYDAAPMLLKAHIAAYDRTTKSGALSHVREHEDSRVKRYGRLLHNVRTHSDLHEVRQARFGHLPNWGQLSDHDRNKILDAEEEVHRRLKEDDAVRDYAKAKERERQKEAMRSGKKVAGKDLVASGLADKTPGREVQLNMFKGKQTAGIVPLVTNLLRKARPLDGRIEFNGLQISIETGRSRNREWKNPHDGSQGMSRMTLPYGYIRMTEGTDNDHVDCFVGQDREAPEVYVIHTMKSPDFTEYDEDKCVLGVRSPEEARRVFFASYNDPRFYGSMSVWPFEEFKEKVLTAKGQKLEREPMAKSGEEMCKQIGDKLGVDWKKVDLDEFCDGMFEEEEHKDITHGDPIKTAKIVLAHLKEDRHYYTKLKNAMMAKAMRLRAGICW